MNKYTHLFKSSLITIFGIIIACIFTACGTNSKNTADTTQSMSSIEVSAPSDTVTSNESHVNSGSDSVTQPTSESAPEPMSEPKPESMYEPTPEPVSESITVPTVEPITEPVAEPVTEPVTEPIPEPIPEPVTEPVIITSNDAYYDIAIAKEAFELQNQRRADAGVPALVWNDDLYEQCRIRGEEISQKFSHDRPDGSSAASLIGGFQAFGENIAAGQQSASTVVDAWYNSDGHRDNMLNANFTSCAVIYYYTNEGNYHHHWVTVFIK